MNTEERKCPKCKHQHETVLYQETDGSFVCGHLLSDAVIKRYPGFREALALSLDTGFARDPFGAPRTVLRGGQRLYYLMRCH
jgi:hypothetical protein